MLTATVAISATVAYLQDEDSDVNVMTLGNVKIEQHEYQRVVNADGTWRHKNGILPAGDTSYPNLSQVYIKSEATNEDMVALDGNGNGTLDILVLSQAVQTAGFADAQTALNTAFGKSSEKAAEWFDGENVPVTVSSADELKAALDAGETTTSIWAEKGIRVYSPAEFNGCGFNNRVVLVGANDLPITFNSCTMNGGSSVYYVDNTDGIIRGGNIPAVTIK